MKNERERIKELNMLSAYLDNALTAKALEDLESRLEQDLALRQKLENLRQTKVLLNRLGRVSAPRDYTLTPDMVKVRRRKPKTLFSTLRLASAFAAVLLVALFGVQVMLGGASLPTGMLAEAPMMESAHDVNDASPEPLILWSEPGAGGAVPNGRGSGSAQSMAEDSFVLDEPMPEEEIAPIEQPEALPEAEQAPQESLIAESPAMEKDLEGESPILGLNPEQGGELLQRSEPGSPDQKSPPDWSKVIQWSQIGLAVIAVGGSLTLWILRKKII